jgi:hypothetical protein
MSYTLIERKELTEAASSISFSNIPQFYTDLAVVCSLRGDQNANNGFTNIGFNSSTSNFSTRFLQGDGSGAASSTGTRGIAYLSNAFFTSNTFDSTTVYIPNYTGSTNKSFSADSVVENNATLGWQFIVAGLWSNTAAINSIQITPNTGNFVAGSSVSLYGINRQQAIGAPKAVGGAISFANGYWVHSFTGSGTFYTQQTLDCEYLVVAGGGAGGFSVGGGGGAGGFRTGFVQRINGSYPVLVGSGGSGVSVGSNGNNGGNSGFAGINATGGGGGGNNTTVLANSGGSGGGSGEGANQGSGNLGGYTPPEGYAGGAANESAPAYGAGAGGGAGGVGNNGTSSGGGNGGVGLSSTLTGSSIIYAGGGGGSGYNSQNAGIGGSNIGGNGSYFATNTAATNGLTNRGGGGGGGTFSSGGTSGAGGSGIVIIRYKA